MANKAGARYSEWEENKLRELYESYSDTAIAEILGRPSSSVRFARLRLGLMRPQKASGTQRLKEKPNTRQYGQGYAMTDEQKQTIRDEYQSYSDDYIGMMIGKAPTSVREFRRKENLIRKTDLRTHKTKIIPQSHSTIQNFLSMRLQELSV